MTWLFSTFGVAFASALLPLINIEVYLGALAAENIGSVWSLAAVAAAGQMVGKIIYYYLGRNSLSWSWVRRKTDSPKFQASLEKWRHRVGDRPVFGGLLVFLAASVGLPPLAIISVIAGSLRLSFPVFVVTGYVGRVLRFATILGSVGWFVTR